jgi:hypothetical protein
MRLKRTSNGEGGKHARERAALFARLVEALPAIHLLERMKVVALKETQKAIEPLTPKAGTGISISMGIKETGF